MRKSFNLREVTKSDWKILLEWRNDKITRQNFFNSDLVGVCSTLANEGKRVIIAGLDMDFLGKPFGVIPQLLAVAEHVTKVHAICIDCGSIANHSFRLTKNKELVRLGEKDEYKPLCRKCFSENI